MEHLIKTNSVFSELTDNSFSPRLNSSMIYYTTFQKYAYIGLKQNLLRSTALDIIPRLFDNAAFVCVHVVGRFSEDFLELRGLGI